MTRRREPKKTVRTNAVIYTRVSTEEQVSNLSLSTQAERSTAYCATNGWVVVHVFTDAGKSAKTTDREAFQKMLKFAMDPMNAIGNIVVHDLSRFSRSVADQTQIIAQLASFGIHVRSVMQPTDDTSTGKFLQNMTGVMNQYENDVRSERTVIGMTKAANMGRFPFKAPLGYINVSAQTGQNLIPDAKIAPLIKAAFDLAGTGMHAKTEILKRLTGLGFQTAKGSPVSAQTFQKILVNPIYAGWIVIPTWGLKVRGSFEPLVTEEQFQRVQDVLSGKKLVAKAYLRNNPDFPLRIFIRCAQCGESITGSWSTGRNNGKHAYDHCRGRGCRGVSVKREVLERKFVAFLEWFTPNPELFSAFKAEVRAVWKQRQGDSQVVYAASQQKLSKAKTRKDKLVDHFIEGRIDASTYAQQVVRLDEEREKIMNDIRNDLASPTGFEPVLPP